MLKFSEETASQVMERSREIGEVAGFNLDDLGLFVMALREGKEVAVRVLNGKFEIWAR